MRSGDIVTLDLGVPEGSEAGFLRPAVVATADVVLGRGAQVIQVVPLTTTERHYETEVSVPAAATGLPTDSVAQVHHVRSVAVSRVIATRGAIGPVALAQLRELLADLLDL